MAYQTPRCVQRRDGGAGRDGAMALADRSVLKSISVSPDPPVPGQNLTVTVEADVQQVIEVSLVYIKGLARSDSRTARPQTSPSSLV